MKRDRFAKFVQDSLLPCLSMVSTPYSVVVNASIHHVDEIADLIPRPVEVIFSQAKSIMKLNDKLLQATTALRATFALMIFTTEYLTHISHCVKF